MGLALSVHLLLCGSVCALVTCADGPSEALGWGGLGDGEQNAVGHGLVNCQLQRNKDTK